MIQPPTTSDNCPGEDRYFLWKKQLAILRGGVQQQLPKTFGESTAKKWLKGQGCGGAKARKLVSKQKTKDCCIETAAPS